MWIVSALLSNLFSRTSIYAECALGKALATEAAGARRAEAGARRRGGEPTGCSFGHPRSEATRCAGLLPHLRLDEGGVGLHGDLNAVPAVRDFLQLHSDALLARGVARERIVWDYGIGFGKSVAQTRLTSPPRVRPLTGFDAVT